MQLKNEDSGLKLEIVNYEFPEAGAWADEYERNWLLVRCTWVDSEGYTRKDSNACLLAQELAGLTAGLKVLLAGIRDRYDSDFVEPDFTFSAWTEEGGFRVSATFYLPNTMDGEDTAELDCRLTDGELKALIEGLDRDCARFPERK